MKFPMEEGTEFLSIILKRYEAKFKIYRFFKPKLRSGIKSESEKKVLHIWLDLPSGQYLALYAT